MNIDLEKMKKQKIYFNWLKSNYLRATKTKT